MIEDYSRITWSIHVIINIVIYKNKYVWMGVDQYGFH